MDVEPVPVPVGVSKPELVVVNLPSVVIGAGGCVIAGLLALPPGESGLSVISEESIQHTQPSDILKPSIVPFTGTNTSVGASSLPFLEELA